MQKIWKKLGSIIGSEISLTQEDENSMIPLAQNFYSGQIHGDRKQTGGAEGRR